MDFVKRSIRNKLIVFLCLATIIPMVTFIMITYTNVKNNVQNTSVQQNSNLIFQGKTNIENYMNILNQISLSVYNDPIYYSAGTQTLYKIIINGPTYSENSNEIYRSMLFLNRSMKEIYQTKLYIAKGDQTYLMMEGLGKVADGKQYSPTISNTKPTVEPPHLSHEYGTGYYPYFDPSIIMTFNRPLFELPSDKIVGTLSLDVRMNVINQICEQLYAKEHEQLYVLDEQGTVIYSPNPEQVGKVLDESWVQHVQGVTDSKGSFAWDQDQFAGLHIYEKISTTYMNWTIVKRIPYDYLYQDARQLTQINVMLGIVFLIVIIAATLTISIKITAPIKNLIASIRKVEPGNLDVVIDISSQDETGQLAKRFNQMMQKINELVVREYRLDLANKTYQLKALQAQINPHFMYNTLQLIGTMALQHDAPKIYALITSLGRMMRYSMNTHETIVPLAREIDHVKAYLALQKQRFDEQLEVVYTLDERFDSILVPKMTLQPIVENYFKHGFLQNDSRIEIQTSSAAEGSLHIRITDNGKGINAERLQEIQDMLSRCSSEMEVVETQESIGLLNVLSRLKFHFGSEAQLILESPSNGGLIVTINIPLLKEET
ncbi:sensor histidine kinase [Paenibacillus sp. N1-5-1-14]|uniref:cache domain-containing sensor histidine kinase n=1 Tax=Paenibacillus radicibacter TaxID=2972488 RepID=UPI002159A502|nr:sensor histidine kinase [Paenibacillus radicibacter]MCR8645127.1 sensor histidine kinase [Paenibacillus radicibacter]